MRHSENIRIKTPPALAIQINTQDKEGEVEEKVFTTLFRIGRDPSNDVHIQAGAVSRHHAEVFFLGETWWIKDLNSANGIFINGKRIKRYPLGEETIVELGSGGPFFLIKVKKPAEKKERKPSTKSLEEYQAYYFSDVNNREDVGDCTMMVRRAFAMLQKKQKNKYACIIAAITTLFLFAGSIAVYKHLQLQKQKTKATDFFYAIKSLDLKFANYLNAARENKDIQAAAQVKKYRQEKKRLEESYSKFIETIGVYTDKISPEDQLILKTARTFGECELQVQKGFINEVHRYIKKWQSTGRYLKALQKASDNKYPETIAAILKRHDMPPQFFYIALQESDFDLHACGPDTRWGIAKGMWQFIPSTASDFGLKIVPLANVARPDPHDDRHDFLKSTNAAARYLRMIHDTDAQASGLLVVTSYNWGQNRVIKMIRNMPVNPKERNFWRFLTTYKGKIPKQTYDYVLYVFSAAVIGEDPRLFGFDLENPLCFLQASGV